MIQSVSAICKHCEHPTDSIYVIGGKAYCPACIEKFKRGVEEELSRILIIHDIVFPSHSGETVEGYALVQKNDKWLFVVDKLYAKPGSATEQQSVFYELPDDFFVDMTFDRLADALVNVVKLSNGTIYSSYSLEDLINRRAYDVEMISELFQ